jgi:glycosyltransferase involved in cell wall biosynthesis
MDTFATDEDTNLARMGPVAAVSYPPLAPLFWLAERRGAVSAWWGHVPFAHWIVDAIRPRVLVELGTHTGVSYGAFCNAVRCTSLSTRCFAVDTWQGDHQTGFYGEELYQEFRQYHDEHFAAFSSLLRGTFDAAIGKIADGSVDLLHIDGLHVYEAVRHDFETWAPKLSERGVVLFHDTNERGRDFGVWRLWADLSQRFPSFEFLHSHGLGVLAVGPEVPRQIADLCAASCNATAAIRQRFEFLGERWVFESREQQAAADATSRRMRVTELEGALQQSQAASVEREARNGMLERELEGLRTSAADATARVAEAEKRLRRTQQELQRVAAQLESVSLEHQALSLERQTLSLEHQALLTSTIWRATRPARELGRRLPAPARVALRRAAKLVWWTSTMQLPRRYSQRRSARRQLRLVAPADSSHAATVLQREPPTRDGHTGPASANGDSLVRRPSSCFYPLPGNLTIHPEIDARPTHALDVSVSVVIPTYNAGPEWRWLLRKLKAQKGVRQLEVITVDSGSSDGTSEFAEQQGCQVIRISKSEFSHSFARNLGASRASGDMLLFMVQDAYPVGDYWVYGLARALFEPAHGRISAVSAAEFPRSDSEIFYDFLMDTHYTFLGCRDNDRVGRLVGSDHMSLRMQGQLSDVACMLPRPLFAKFGYEGRYAEDLRLGIRLIRDGHQIAILSSIKVIHSHNRPPGYYLRRCFVDLVFLRETLVDYPLEEVFDIVGVLHAAGAVNDLLHARLADDYQGVERPEDLISDLARSIRRMEFRDPPEVHATPSFGIGPFASWAAEVIDKRRGEPALRRSEAAKRFTHMYVERLEALRAFLARIYPFIDPTIYHQLRDAVFKVLASTLGIQIGFAVLAERSDAQWATLSPEEIRTVECCLADGV